MKKILIVGGGVAGLSAGVYAARSGFDVTILEQHSTFGGLSTGWSRRGYFFEGGMHWLTGSRENLPMNNLWKDIGALKENNPIENRDPVYTLIDGDERVCLYRYLPEMEKELLRYAPEDKAMIKKMCRDIKVFSKVFMPVFDVAGCKCKHPVKQNIGAFIKMLPVALRFTHLKNASYTDYVNQFKNKNIRHLLMSVIGYRYNALSFIYTLGAFASGDCGYPHGGSIQLEQNILDTYKSYGGKIKFRQKVTKINVEKGHVKSVQTKDGEIPCDAVIVTQDARAAVDTLFDSKIDEHWVNKMRSEVIPEQNIFISAGVKANLSKLPYSCIFPLKKPFEYAGCKWSEIRINNYAKYKGHSPEGGTSITCLLIGDSYNYWKAAKLDGSYREKKETLKKLFLDTLAEFIPEVKEKLDVIDIATPCTYERYCGSYEGSWMSIWNPGGFQNNFPQKLNSISGVYFAGQRILMPGGLPVAAYTGRRAVQYLCRDLKMAFD